MENKVYKKVNASWDDIIDNVEEEVEDKIYRVTIGISEEEGESIGETLEWDIEDTGELCIYKNVRVKAEDDFFSISCKITRTKPGLNYVSLNIVITSENKCKKIASYTKSYNKGTIYKMYDLKRISNRGKVFLINIDQIYDKEDIDYDVKKRMFYKSKAYSLNKEIKKGNKTVIYNEIISKNFEKEEDLALITLGVLISAKGLPSILQLYMDKLNYVGIDIEDYCKYKLTDFEDVTKSKDPKKQLEFMINLVNLMVKEEISDEKYIRTIAHDIFVHYINNFYFE